MMLRWTLAVVCVLLSGCAARASYFLVDAARAYRDAEKAQAEERAPYEFTLAGEYLHKAREEAGYSDYSAAEKLAKRSIEESRRAIERAEERGVPVDDAAVPDEAAKRAPVAPADSAPTINLDEE